MTASSPWDDGRVPQSTFDEAPIGIAHTNLAGRFLRVNRWFFDLLGYTAEELADTDFRTISHPDEVSRDVEALAQLIAGTIARHAREKRYRRKDGTFIWASLTVTLHRDAGGKPAYFIAIVQDLTERKNLEQQVRQAHKMEAVGQLAGGIAHDFNNLLTAIVGYADLALKQVDEGDPLRDDIEAICAAGRSAASLTRQLLAFSRGKVLQPQAVDLNIVVGRTTPLLRRVIGEHIEIACRLAHPLDRVNADPGQMQQVVMNLALNARDAMPRGGTLTIETGVCEIDESYVATQSAAKAGPHVMLAISDTGSGLDERAREHLFEPFYTTKEPGQGTGLGLATVYGIVKQSGGSILVYSEHGHGTTFKVFLPRADGAAEVVESTPPPSETLEGTETILLVEDQSEVRSVARETLKRHGYTVLEGATAADALSVAARFERPIHLLLSDVVMPAVSGPDLADRIRRIRPEMSVLFMSGYTHYGRDARGSRSPAPVFVQKPFTPAQLLRKERDVLDTPKDANGRRKRV